MAKQRYIDTKFWDDSYVVKLDPTEKLLFIYLLTNPLTNIAGIYEIAVKRISFDIGIDQEMVLNILDRFSKDKKVFYINGWVIISNFPKHQNYQQSPKIKQGIELILADLPQELLDSIYTLSIPYLYPLNYSNSNSNSLTETQNVSVGKKKLMTIRAYNENEFSDAHDQRIDMEGAPIKRPKKVKAENKRRGEAEELLREYHKGYEEFVGEKKDITYFSKAAYLKMAYVALPHYPLQELKEMLTKYLKTDNKIYRDNNWSMSCFLSLKVLGQLKNGK